MTCDRHPRIIVGSTVWSFHSVRCQHADACPLSRSRLGPIPDPAPIPGPVPGQALAVALAWPSAGAGRSSSVPSSHVVLSGRRNLSNRLSLGPSLYVLLAFPGVSALAVLWRPCPGPRLALRDDVVKGAFLALL